MATKRSGRPAKHDWSNKRDLCHRLYVDENKSVKEIRDYFIATPGVDAAQLPNARDFSRQFVRWKFPSRRDKLPADDEGRLVHRIKELWESNHVQKQMLDVLASEGWQIDQNALARLRRKHGIVLRVAAGYNRENMGPGSGKKRKHTGDDVAVQDATVSTGETTVDVAPDEAARRAQRLTDIQTNSDAQLSSGSRRRRIRGYAHLPPDAAGLPPRYKSETSLDECKAYLSMTNELYREIRQKFEDICNEMGIIKKRLCNEGEWSTAKNRLIRESIHLSALLNPVHGDTSERENALEVVCADVTKRMRNMKKRIFVKEANNILGLNPEQSKELRRQFFEILKADGFQTMLLCGKEHWDELRRQWFDNSDLVQQLYAPGLDEEKRRCVDVLLRDAMKRHNDNNVIKMPKVSHGPGPGPARRVAHEKEPTSKPAAQSATVRHMDLDPALFAALSSDLTSLPFDMGMQSVQVNSHQLGAVPAFFRLSTESRMMEQHPIMWLATLNRATLEALYTAAASKVKNARVAKISGVVKHADAHEDHYQIDCSEELEAYLETVKELASKATFLVVFDAGIV